MTMLTDNEKIITQEEIDEANLRYFKLEVKKLSASLTNEELKEIEKEQAQIKKDYPMVDF